MIACHKHCSLFHKKSCATCKGLLQAAQIILDSDGICHLSSLFRKVFPSKVYTSATAQSRFLRMPVVAIRVGHPSSGHSYIHLMENIHGVDYVKLQKHLESFTESQQPLMKKQEYHQLLALCQSRREHEMLTYTLSKASGLSMTAMRRHYGANSMDQRCREVEDALHDTQMIRESVEELAAVQLAPSSDCTSSESASDSDTEAPMSFSDISELDLTEIVQHSDFNWFAVTETMESNGYTKTQLEELFSSVLSSELSEMERRLLVQSHDAYISIAESQDLADRES